MKKNIVIFDLDGTLINSKPKFISDVKNAFRRLGYNLTNEEIENAKDWYELAEKHTINKERFDYEFDKRKSWKESLEDGDVPIFEDTIPCLENLCSKDFSLGVLTKSNPEYTKQKLEFYNLNKYFGKNIAVTPITSKTKEREAIELIKKINPSKIKSAYFIGDRSEDVLIEKNVQKEFKINANGIWLNRDYKGTPKELIEYKQINSLNEMNLTN